MTHIFLGEQAEPAFGKFPFSNDSVGGHPVSMAYALWEIRLVLINPAILILLIKIAYFCSSKIKFVLPQWSYWHLNKLFEI